MANVNPSPIRPPRKWLSDPEISKDVQSLYFYLYQLWQRTGGGGDFIEENITNITIINNDITVINEELDRLNTYNPVVQAQFNDLLNRIGSGDALTSDETGFTVDSTTLSVDMTEA